MKQPTAKLIPIDTTPVSAFGCLKNTVTIRGDIIAPIDEKWEAEKQFLNSLLDKNAKA